MEGGPMDSITGVQTPVPHLEDNDANPQTSSTEWGTRNGMEPNSSEPSETQPATTAQPFTGFFRYRWRMHLTLAVLLVAWVGVGFSPPFLQNGSLGVILLDYLGWLMFIGGLSLRFWATRFIGGRKSCEVISYGPYSLTRNPLYVGTFLMILSLACFLKSPSFAVATVIVIAYYDLAVVPLEERFLRQTFGAAYTTYCEGVPRWLPRVGTIYSPPVELIQHPMQNEARRAVWWFLLPLLAEIHTYIRALPEWPRWFNWP